MFCQLALLCLCILIWKLFWKKQSLEPPVLSGKLPIVGHAYKIMGDSIKMYSAIQKISEECLQKGGLITVNLGPSKTYYVADPEDCLTIANSCLEKHYFFAFLKSFLGKGLITADVSTWKIHRKLLNPAFQQQNLDNFIEIFNTQAQSLIERFASEIGKPFNHENFLRTNNLETICLTAFGVEVREYGDLNKRYLSRLTNIIQSVNERIQKFWLHSDFIYNMTREKKMLEDDIEHLLPLSTSIIQKKKSEREYLPNKEKKAGKPKTFIDLILNLACETGCFTDEEIREETDTIIVGGHDTTAYLMTIVLTLLGSLTEVQNKVYDEILQVLGNSERNIEKDDLSKLVYTEAVFKETLRLYPIVPILPRLIDKDVRLKNYTIKANSECFIAVYGLHRHNIWGPDADKFRPERWLDKETLPDLKYFAAFGLGRRSCIGKTYAMMAMKILLIHVVRKYHISSDISKMVVKMHVMIRPASGHHITLTHRNIV